MKGLEGKGPRRTEKSPYLRRRPGAKIVQVIGNKSRGKTRRGTVERNFTPRPLSSVGITGATEITGG